MINRRLRNMILTAGVAAVLVFSAAACGGSSAAGSSAAKSSAAASSAASSAAVSSAAASTAAASSAASSQASGEAKFESPDGWAVRYESSLISCNKVDEHAQSFVYTGECAGTCMVTIGYMPGKKATDVTDDTIKNWGVDIKDIDKSETTFPGTDNVKGYYLEYSTKEGVPMSMTLMVGDYKDGALAMEFIFTKSNKEDIDMAASDVLSAVIDSITYK